MRNVAVIRSTALLMGAALLSSSALLMAQAGSLDPTFGKNGIVITPNTDTAAAIALQSDGKIVVAGSVIGSNGFPELGLARYTSSGDLDSSFGTAGIVSNSDAPAFAVAVQSNGQILVGTIASLGFAVLRFNSDGSLDTTFGTNGTASFRPFEDLFFSPLTGGIVVLSDGKILVAAEGGFGGGVMVRLLANGQLDASFGAGGAGAVQLLNAPGTVALLPSGKILVSTIVGVSLAARYTSTGALDASFGVSGQVADLGGNAIIPLTNGEFVAVGSLVTETAPPPAPNNTQGFSVVLYNPKGVIDTTFGTNGAAVTTFPPNTYSAAFAVAVQSNGEIVAGGETAPEAPGFGGPGPVDFAVARYTTTGQLDTTFGSAGLVTTDAGNSTFITALAIQSDGKILALGGNANPAGESNPGFTLARYLAQ
jgi:uncharacterized delta-60 repeat protein